MKSSLEIAKEQSEIAQKRYEEAKKVYEGDPNEQNHQKMLIEGKKAIEAQREVEQASKKTPNPYVYWQPPTPSSEEIKRKRIAELRSTIETAQSYDTSSSRALETSCQNELAELEGRSNNNDCSIM